MNLKPLIRAFREALAELSAKDAGEAASILCEALRSMKDGRPVRKTAHISDSTARLMSSENSAETPKEDI